MELKSESRESILVTGASGGIGQAIAIRLAADGFHVVLHYSSNLAGAEETARQIAERGGSCRVISFDQGEREQTRRVLEADIAEHGAYYGVVCNAGISRDAAFPMMTGDDWDQVMDVNLDGFFNVLHPVVMPMIQRRKPGRIITVSSASGLMGNRGQVNYSASKAGVIGATKALAIELAKRQITVNCVAPGIIETDMTDKLPMEKILEAIPARRSGKASEVAAVVAFLCSNDAGYVTRQVISVNGGLY
jgi:3-oxoacyl-[acyl-carrier protein] reductase